MSVVSATIAAPAAASPVPAPAEEHRTRLHRRLLLAAIGGVLVADSAVLRMLPGLTGEASLRSWLDDGGIIAGMCALVGLAVLLAGMAEVAWHRERGGSRDLNALVLLAVLASLARANLDGGGAVALQTAGAIAFFLLLTLIIESQSALGAHRSLEALARLTPGRARRRRDGREELVEPEQLAPGDRLEVRPGETVHADGVIKQGNSALQEANITGESLPVDKTVGGPVFAGTINLSGLLDIEVTRAGRDTTLGKVRELILQAERTRPALVRLVDQYIRYYTPVIVVVAAIVWLASGDLGRVAAVLVAACPIALILAWPSAIMAALSAAARLGVLIKNVTDLEVIARLDAVVFDKTGTVTTGQLGVVRLAPAEGLKPADLVRLAAAAEQHSNHPVAVAIRELAQRVRVSVSPVTDLHEQPGRGVRANVEGQTIVAGNLAWMQEHGKTAADFPARNDQEAEGVSLLYVLRDDAPLGWIALQDQTRPESAGVMAELEGLGVPHLALVTGDREAVAARVATELHLVHWRAACVPAQKVEYVEEIKQQGRRVAFVGDGVNDAPALAASHVGIAMGAAGSDVALETATVALLNSRLNRIPFLLRLARHARLVMIGNFALGGVFIFGGMALGAAGLLSPLLAAVIQVVSSVGVVMNSARLVREGEDLDQSA